MKRSVKTRMVYVKDINHNIPTTWTWARGDLGELHSLQSYMAWRVQTTFFWHFSLHFSSVQSFDWLGCSGDMRDDSAEILFQPFLQEALVSSSGTGKDVHSMLSIQHCLCWPWRHTPSKVPWRMVLERLSWHMTHPNHASFHLLTVASRGSCGPTRKLILLPTQSLVLCSKWRCREVSSGTWFWKPGSFFQSSSSRVHVSQSQMRMAGTKRLVELHFF